MLMATYGFSRQQSCLTQTGDSQKNTSALNTKKIRFLYLILYHFLSPRSGAGLSGTARDRQASTFHGGSFSALKGGRETEQCTIFLLWIAMAGKLYTFAHITPSTKEQSADVWCTAFFRIVDYVL